MSAPYGVIELDYCMPQPSSNGSIGRDERGRFAQGNAGGPGNPHAGKVARLRTALLAAVTEDDVREIVERLVRLAKEGDLAAIRELFLRTIGRPLEPDILERLERLEAAVQPSGNRWH